MINQLLNLSDGKNHRSHSCSSEAKKTKMFTRSEVEQYREI